MSTASRTVETYASDAMHGGDFPIRGATATIASGADLVKGSVLGRITSGGKYVLSTTAASDGSQTPAAILAEDAAAAGGDVSALIYTAGDFIAEELTFGASHTAATVETAFRAAQAPLFVKSRTPL